MPHRDDLFRNLKVPELEDHYSVVPSPRHPESCRLYEFWQARGPEGIVVGRDVPSREIASLLSHIVIWEPVDQGRDLKVRLAGASLQRRFPFDIKGRLMSELFAPDDFQHHLTTTVEVLESGKPLVTDSRLIRGTVEELHLEVVVLPVVAPDRISKWVMTGLFYFS